MEKFKAISTKYYSSLLGRMYFTRDDGFQNMFVYQPTFNTLKYKNTSTEDSVSWRTKGVYNAKHIRLNSNFLPNINYFERKIGIQFNNNSLVAEQNNYLTKFINVYIVYDLDHWPNNSLRNFILNKVLFGATNIVKNNNKEKYVYSGYGIAFDGKVSWRFNHNFARNVIIFGLIIVHHFILTVLKMFFYYYYFR